MTQQDVVEQHTFDDAVSFGGWAIDHHPADGVYSESSPCTQYHAKGVYQIPLRSFVSKDINNLFLAGRIISVSHIAFGSTRVMATCGHGGQAVGQAVAHCLQEQIKPAQLWQGEHIQALQNRLNEQGHFIPDVPIKANENLAKQAKITASTELSLAELAPSKIDDNIRWKPLTISAGQLLPLEQTTQYQFDVTVKVAQSTHLHVELRDSIQPQNYTPDNLVEKQSFELNQGVHKLSMQFANFLPQNRYALLCFLQNEHVSIACSDTRISGLVSVFNGANKAVSNTGKQIVDGDIGIDEFEFWTPERRPKGHNIALQINPAIESFTAANVINGYTRPYLQSNAWIAALSADTAELTLEWSKGQKISEIILHFDGDFDHAMESSLYGHPEDRIPFCVSNYSIFDGNGDLVQDVSGNYQTVNHLLLDTPVNTSKLTFKFERANKHIPISLFELIVR